MKLKAIVCDVLAKEFYHAAAHSTHNIDIEIVSSKEHEYPNKIHEILQKKLQDIEAEDYDYILLGYGLCGKALSGLQSVHVPLVVPRAHDCITLFMGSKEKYQQTFFENTGTMYYIAAWLERNGVYKERREVESIGLGGSYEKYLKKYGEEGARHLIEIANSWQSNYKQAMYIENPTTMSDFSCEVEALAAERGWKFSKMAGNSSLIERFLWGDWLEQDFLVVEKGHKIVQSGDASIVRSVRVES